MSDPRVQAALIAAAVSLIVSLLSYWAALHRIRAERRNLEERLKRGLTEKLYSLRLEIYPEAFEITSDAGKYAGRTDKEIIEHTRETLDQLMGWERERAGLVLSRRSLRAFYALRDALSRGPGDGNAYTSEQLENMWRARNVFRGRLRDDVGLLYEEDPDVDV